MKILSLFRPEEIPPRVRFEKLFSHLPAWAQKISIRGRPPFARESLLRALIYQRLRGLASLTDLAFELENNPAVAVACGFSMFHRPPSRERFSRFLRTTPHKDLEDLRKKLVTTLIEEKTITGGVIALDSCAIEANVRENNLKTSVKDRFDKTKFPRGDPDARLGVKIHFPQPFQPKVAFYWGYRNHIIIDTESELPIYEITCPNDRDEKKVAVPMLKEATALALPVSAVTGDANYDCEDILSYIALEMKAHPVIPINPRRPQNDSFRLQKDGVLCPANLPMHRKGRMTSKGRVYLQHSCPLHWDKAYRGKYLLCPAGHPKFVNQKGCNYLLRLSPSIRDTIDYDAQHFKTIYNQRTSVERGFSRLLAIAMQNPTVVGLTATRNHCTIAHITMLLVALAAHREGFPDKIRYVKSFLPRYLV
jgi:transposase